MTYGSIPNNHKDQALPPDQRSPPESASAGESAILGQLSAAKPQLFIGSNGFFRERDHAFRPEMNTTDIGDFLTKYGIAYPKKCRLTFYAFCYTAILTGRIGGEGSSERAIIWLHHHKFMKVVEWNATTGLYIVNGKRYRLNHILMLRRPTHTS